MATDTTTTDHAETDDERDAPHTNQMITRRFDGVSLAHENAATQALIAKATADTQSRWVMAMKKPRNPHDVRQLIIAECKRPGFAKTAMYSIPRAGKMVTGLSIRFAEVAMRCMGNLSCEAQTLYDSDEERVIRVTATDFETNTTWPRDITIKKTVERKQLARGQRPIRQRANSFGDTVYIVEATDDEIAFKEAAAISKAARTAILRLIPGHLQDLAKDLVTQTLTDAASKDPAGEANQMFDAFAGLNIMPSDIAQWLGHAVDRITPAEIVELKFLYVALRDQDMSWADALENADKIRERAKKAAPSKPANGAATPAANTNEPKTTPATTTAQPAPDKTAASTGKGTQATKDKIKGAKAEPAKTEPASNPTTAPTPAAKTEPEPPAKDPPVVTAPPVAEATPLKEGYEDRDCTMCGCPIEVPKTDPAGAQCYACSRA